jgi:hypothetical protein
VTAAIERVLTRTDRSSGCWIWQGGKAPNGYGLVKSAGRSLSVHRLSYEHHKGPIADGLHIDHLCRTRACVNPDHLEAVTCRENLLRGKTKAAENVAKTHCIRGHAFNEENTQIRSDGTRRCRVCGREDRRRYVARKAAA